MFCFNHFVSHVFSLPYPYMSLHFPFAIYHNPLDPLVPAMLDTGEPFTLARRTKILDCDPQTAANRIYSLLHDGLATTEADRYILKRCSSVNILHTMLLSETTLYALYNQYCAMKEGLSDETKLLNIKYENFVPLWQDDLYKMLKPSEDFHSVHTVRDFHVYLQLSWAHSISSQFIYCPIAEIKYSWILFCSKHNWHC